MAISQKTETESPPIVETWRFPAALWAMVCLLIQIPALENRSFEPDEGLRVYCARELLQDRTPYRDFWDHKDPTEWLLCAGLMLLFGDSLSGLRLGINGLRAALVYHLCGLGQQARVGKNAWLTGGLATALLIAEPIQGNTSAMEIPALLLFVIAMRLFAGENPHNRHSQEQSDNASLRAKRGNLSDRACEPEIATWPPLADSGRFLAMTGRARHFLSRITGPAASLFASVPGDSSLVRRISPIFLSVLAGVLSGFAVLLKPTAALACLPALLVLSMSGFVRRPVGIAVGMAAAFGMIFTWCLSEGILSDWFFVMAVYNPSYSRGAPHWEYLSGVVPPRLFFLLPFALLAVVGFLQQKKSDMPNRLWLPTWLIGGVLSVCIGWRFYPHYFLLLVPPMALAGSHAVTTTTVLPVGCPRTRSLWIWILLPFVLFQSLRSVKWYWTEAGDWKPPAIGFFTNEDILRLAAEIRHDTTPRDTLFVIGYCPDLYVLSERRSASRYFFHLPYTAEHSPIREPARNEVLETLQNTSPKFIVVMKKDRTPQHPIDSDKFVEQWTEMRLFLEENYLRMESRELFDAYILKGQFNPPDDTDRPTPSRGNATEYAHLRMKVENGDSSHR